LSRALKTAAPPYATVEVRRLTGTNPVQVEVDNPAFRQMDRAFREVEGRGVVLVRSGGSLPIMAELGKGGAPVLLSGIGLPDDRLHAPNEKISIEQFTKGIRVFSRFFDSLGTERDEHG
jgi:acetylornithine deacetylase/succinyl-diaminopimelate desuccinylase-like protein